MDNSNKLKNLSLAKYALWWDQDPKKYATREYTMFTETKCDSIWNIMWNKGYV